MPKKGITYGSGGPGTLGAGFKAKTNKLAPGGTGANSCWRGTDGPLGAKYQQQETNATGRGLTASLKGGLLMGTTTHPYDQQSGSEATPAQSGTSIFDPVLCELAYRWFCPPDGHVLDPFAGGSVRGIVAAKLGRQYTGIDLRPEQAAANEAQAERICTDCPKPTWIVGDAVDVAALTEGEYDFIFSCPPYLSLEVYSDDPRDLSTMDDDSFMEAYCKIVADCVGMLKDDRFACFVVGDVRDKNPAGFYKKFPARTVDAFEAAGAMLHNDAVLVTAVGSLPIRVGRQFDGGRKLGRTHQSVLVFCKGDPKKATEAVGTVEIDESLFSDKEDIDTVPLF